MLSKPLKKYTDEELLALFKQKNDLAFLGELYDRYMSLVYGVCLKYLKDREESRDAVMQIFEKLAESVKIHEVNYFKSWLYVLVKNHCLMKLRSQKAKRFEEIPDNLVEMDGLVHQDDGLDTEFKLGRLERCLQELGKEQQACIRLFYLEQKCYKEITVITGYEILKVKSYIQNGKRNLKLCMERNE
jgi:RNA polymerase sigma factor (sigma-70 family)